MKYDNHNKPIKRLRLDPPLLYGHTVLGTVFSIIKPKDLPWIYSHFSQVMYHNEWQMIIFEEQIRLLEMCPFLQTHYIYYDEALYTCSSFSDMIMYLIDNDYYVYLFLDNKYIFPDRFKQNFAHTTLISGFDKIKNVFYLSDNYNMGKFTTIEVNMETVEKAFYSAWTAPVGNEDDNDTSRDMTYLKGFYYFKYNEDVVFKFDSLNFTKQLRSYLDCTSIFMFGYKSTISYGCSIYELTIKHLANKNNIILGIKDFHLLYEHKLLMIKRLEYIINQNIILCDENYVNRANEICNELLIIRNLFIKQMISNSNEKERLIIDICNRLNNVNQKEKKLLGEVLFKIETSLKNKPIT